MRKTKREKVKKAVGALGLGMLCAACIYTTLVYAAVKSLVKYEEEEYNTNTTN